MSSLRTRPPMPVPGIALRSRSCSRARRRASGEMRCRSSSPSRAGAGAVIGAADAVAACAAAARGPLAAPALSALCLSMTATLAWDGVSTCAVSGPGAVSSCADAETSAFSSITAISTPTGTVWSACTRIFARRPATGEGSSALILSVMISASDSLFLHPVALLLQPASDRPFRDRFAQTWHFYRCWHRCLPF